MTIARRQGDMRVSVLEQSGQEREVRLTLNYWEAITASFFTGLALLSLAVKFGQIGLHGIVELVHQRYQATRDLIFEPILRVLPQIHVTPEGKTALLAGSILLAVYIRSRLRAGRTFAQIDAVKAERSRYIASQIYPWVAYLFIVAVPGIIMALEPLKVFPPRVAFADGTNRPSDLEFNVVLGGTAAAVIGSIALYYYLRRLGWLGQPHLATKAFAKHIQNTMLLNLFICSLWVGFWLTLNAAT